MTSDSTGKPRFIGPLDQAFLTKEDDVTELVLIRHGQQNVDYAHAKAGDLVDPPLSDTGVRQAELVGERFIGQRVDVVYGSPLKRAFDTGQAVASHHGLDVIVNNEIREIETWRGLPLDATPADALGPELIAGIRARMARELSWDVYPHSEPSAEFRSRVVTAMETIAAVNNGKRVVVACHGGVINAYLGYVLGLNADMWFRPAHTAVNVVRIGTYGRRVVSSLGDVAHLERVDPTLITH